MTDRRLDEPPANGDSSGTAPVSDAPEASTRREALRTLLAVPAALTIANMAGATADAQQSTQPNPRERPLSNLRRHVVVIGAGAFGGWTALHLLRAGAHVTLVDAWGAGNARSSSGGATRVMRAIYNGRQVYIEMVARALTLWKEHEQRWKRPVFRRTGALWMFHGDDAFARTSVVPMQQVGLTAHEVPHADARRRWPQIDFAGVRSAFLEPEAGYLLARDACELVRDAFVAEGGEYRTAWVKAGPVSGGGMRGVTLSDGATLAGQQFVFACGPWLGGVFPDVIGPRIRATRQPLVYLGPPPGDTRFDEASCPVWIDFSDRIVYGIPGNEHRGFKVVDETLGAIVDPTTMDRVPTSDEIAHLRAVAAHRFPALARSPVLGAEVCQYEYSPDGDFILDRHPGAENVWLLGGGSGHGFKMGPAFGELAAGVILGHRRPEPQFLLARLDGKHPQSKRTA